MKAAVIEKQGGIENIVYPVFLIPRSVPAICWLRSKRAG